MRIVIDLIIILIYRNWLLTRIYKLYGSKKMVQFIRTSFKAIVVSSLAFTASLYADEAVEEIVVKGRYFIQIK